MTDNLELPGLPEIPKKRGRPATGKALTAAERKRRSRAGAYGAMLDRDDWSSIPLTSLMESYGKAMASGSARFARIIAEELVKRAEALQSGSAAK